MSTRDTTGIRISLKTKVALDAIRHPGQSYDGLLQELMAELKKLQEPAPALVDSNVARASGGQHV